MATDPRDKVFAILSLCNPPSGIQADYHLSLQQLEIITTKKLLSINGDLRVLNWAGSNGGNRSEASIPSWSLDLRSCLHANHAVAISSTQGVGNQDSRYKACGGKDDFSQASIRTFEFEDEILVLRGIFVSQISQLGIAAPSNFPRKLVPGSQGFFPVIENWKQLAGPSDSQTFWRTVLGDMKSCILQHGSYGDYNQLNLGSRARLTNEDLALLPQTETDEQKMLVYLDAGVVCQIRNCRRMMADTQSRISLVPEGARVGDRICILMGSEVPYIVRPLENNCYQLIGEW